MQITNTPNDYAPLFGQAIFEILAEESQNVNIEILNSENDTIGIKRVSNNQLHTINVMPYILDSQNINPLTNEDPNLIMDNQRIIPIKIRAKSQSETVESMSIPLLFADKSQSFGSRLSNSPSSRLIYNNSCEQIDILIKNQSVNVDIEFFSNGEIAYTQKWGTINNNSGIASINVNAQKIITIADCDNKIIPFRFKIAIGDKVSYVDYLLLADCSEKLAIKWINQFGGIDSHPFESISEQNIKTSKNAIAECTSIQKSFTITSEAEDAGMAQWICEAMSARKVWLSVNNSIFEVKILTDNINLINNHLQKISFVILPKNDSNLKF